MLIFWIVFFQFGPKEEEVLYVVVVIANRRQKSIVFQPVLSLDVCGDYLSSFKSVIIYLNALFIELFVCEFNRMLFDDLKFFRPIIS